LLDSREVVVLDYDPTRLSADKLVTTARKQGVAARVYATTTAQKKAARKAGVPVEPLRGRKASRSPKDDKYQLRHSRLRKVPMTALQRTKVNAALSAGQSPLVFLSPRQREIYRRLLKKKTVTAMLMRGWQ
jgi:hypothetical protein